MTSLDISKLSKYFVFATIVNLIAAVVFTAPVLVPEYTFPLILTVWPGTWIFIAYFAFLIAGVLGSLGWAVLFDLVEKHFRKKSVNRYLAEAHFSLTYVALYGETILVFVLGYQGGGALLNGIGRGVITQGLIGWMVVPIGVFIYLYLIGTVIGLANVILTIAGAKWGT